MRTLLASPDPRAAEAVDLFVYRIGRELGSLAAALGGLDALVFTGGIGENVRRRPRPGVPERRLARAGPGRRRLMTPAAPASAVRTAASRPGSYPRMRS